MKVATVDRTELKGIVASPSERGAKSAKERAEIIGALEELQSGPQGQVLQYQPEEKETTRGLKMRISRAAKEAGITDVRTGVHQNGNLLVWREAKAARKPRKNGKVEAPALAAV